MTKYLQTRFTVANTSKAYRDNWARIFKPCCAKPTLRQDPDTQELECVSCGADYEEPHPDCEQCGQPFTAEQWEDRHDAEDKRQSVHAQCCVNCKEEQPIERCQDCAELYCNSHGQHYADCPCEAEAEEA